MKGILVVLFSLCTSLSFAHSPEECYKYVDDVLSLVLTSPEWNDCLDEADTNEVEVLFPTMASVFACEMPSRARVSSAIPGGSALSGWPVELASAGG